MSTVSRTLTRASCHCHVNPPYSPFRLRAAFHATPTRSLHAGRSIAPLQSGVTVRTLFTVLAVVGVATTAYGVYDFYSSLTKWPKELREHLRPAIKAQHQGNLTLSERYLQRAWDTSLALPKETLGEDPWLKISGIACKLGEVLEAAQSPQKAYEVYKQCWSLMNDSAARNELSTAERHRAIAISMHLGELASQLGKKEEERWLTWSVQEFAKFYQSIYANPSTQQSDQPAGMDLTLPPWTQNHEFQSALEALASYWAKAGDIGTALELYLYTISLLLPENSSEARAAVDPQRRCRAAQLMTNISGLLINNDPSPERLAQARLWTSKGVEIVAKARKELARVKDPECEQVWAVLLYNMGAVLEMESDRKAAKDYFERALAHSRSTGMREGVVEAEDALARLSDEH